MSMLRGVCAISLAAAINICVLAPALAAGVPAAPMAMDGTTILPDPVLKRADELPRSDATAGVARVSAMADGPLKNCSRRNPCALPTPARGHVTVGGGETAATGPGHPDVKYARVSKAPRA